MKRHLTLLVVVFLLGTAAAYGQLMPNLGGQRSGISAFQFLKIGVGPRAVGMGGAFVAVANDASALYWNPAGLVQFPENQMLAAHTEYLVDIKHDYLGVAYHLSDQDAIGASFISLHMSDMEVTTEAQPFGTGRYFSFGDVAVGLTYAKKMTDQFSFGATVRYVEETLDILKMRSFMVDFGTYYWLGISTMRFAVVISNFGSDVQPKGTVTTFDGTTVGSFQTFSLPTVFMLGFAIDPITTDEHVLTTSLQLNHPNDNSEHLRIGVEYRWRDTFFLRGGVKRTIGQSLLGSDETSEESFGLSTGVKVPTGLSVISADYAFSSYGRLGAVHRLSLGLTF